MARRPTHGFAIPAFTAVVAMIFVGPIGGTADGATGTLRFPAADRIVAVGDLHGDLDATRRVLRLAGAIDDDDHWVGGHLVVVQTGDQLDRGDNERAILDLLERLTEEAAAAGGAIHVLNGNHEIMNAALDFRYVTEAGFTDFEDAADMVAEDSVLVSHPAEYRSRVATFRPDGPYARVLAKRNTVIMVGDNVFVHGGVLPPHLDYGLERINAEIRAWLAGDGPEPPWIHGEGSLVWTRRYSDAPDTTSCRTLGDVLERLGALRMVVGHTVQEHGITSYCNDRVWCIDVGMSEHYGGKPAALEIVGDSVRVLREDPVAEAAVH